MYVFNMEVFMPFTYTLSTRYLMEHPQEWTPAVLSVFGFYHLLGYIIYRLSNQQKYKFRKNPNDPALSRKLDIYCYRDICMYRYYMYSEYSTVTRVQTIVISISSRFGDHSYEYWQEAVGVWLVGIRATPQLRRRSDDGLHVVHTLR